MKSAEIFEFEPWFLRQNNLWLLDELKYIVEQQCKAYYWHGMNDKVFFISHDMFDSYVIKDSSFEKNILMEIKNNGANDYHKLFSDAPKPTSENRKAKDFTYNIYIPHKSIENEMKFTILQTNTGIQNSYKITDVAMFAQYVIPTKLIKNLYNLRYDCKEVDYRKDEKVYQLLLSLVTEIPRIYSKKVERILKIINDEEENKK